MMVGKVSFRTISGVKLKTKMDLTVSDGLHTRTYDQLMELLALIKQLGDQVFAVSMSEPPGIQMQDF